jgi:hypothetical protein
VKQTTTTIMLGYGMAKLRMDFNVNCFSTLRPQDSEAECLIDA